MITVPVGTDTRYDGGVRWWDTMHIETGVNPCDNHHPILRVTDEDGDPIIDITMEDRDG